MLQLDLIERFLKKKRIAVVGVSRNKDLPANYIYRKLKSTGYETYAINPNTKEVQGDPCYPSIAKTPAAPEAVVLASTPAVSEQVIKECQEMGISHIWMHRGVGVGSYSAAAEKVCDEHNISAITNGCPMMFIRPIDPFHRCLRWLKKVS